MALKYLVCIYHASKDPEYLYNIVYTLVVPLSTVILGEDIPLATLRARFGVVKSAFVS